MNQKILSLYKAAAPNSKKMEALTKYLYDLIKKISSANRLDISKHTYIVGGAVRNLVIDKSIKDIDVVIDSVALGGYDSDKLAKDLARLIQAPTNLATNNYGVAILSVTGPLMIDGFDFDGEQIEIANARSESYAKGGYKPDEVKPATIKDDIYRREFTFNTLIISMADVANGMDKKDIIDLTGCGLKDLESGEIRCPRDADEIFSDDPSRMLRAIKFMVKYGFKLPDDVRESIIRNSDKIRNIPPNQIGTIIITQILNEPTYRSSLRLMSDLHLLDQIRDILVSPANVDEKALKSFLLGHAKEREVAFLLSLLEAGLPLSGPIDFLSADQKVRLAEITSTMSSEDGWSFIGMLSNPGIAMKDEKFFPGLIRDFTKNKSEIPSFNSGIYKPIVISMLLDDPDLVSTPDILRERVRKAVERAVLG